MLKESAKLVHVPGRFMIADLLTKNVSRPIFLELMKLFANYSHRHVAGLDVVAANAPDVLAASAPASVCACWVCVCCSGPEGWTLVSS